VREQRISGHRSVVSNVEKEGLRRGKSIRKDSGRKRSERVTQKVEAVSLGAEKWHGRGCRPADRYVLMNN
jgi:hypothetical protein